MQASSVPSVPPQNGITDTSFDEVTGFWNSASVLLKRKQPIASKKQGVLSTHAAPMLESERDTNTKWCPVMEIRYRGEIYKGRCQGGLPEGRGRLTFLDGTVYDGMWRYGKRSRISSLCFSNGDVFHGSWRDDLMHGKLPRVLFCVATGLLSAGLWLMLLFLVLTGGLFCCCCFQYCCCLASCSCFLPGAVLHLSSYC